MGHPVKLSHITSKFKKRRLWETACLPLPLPNVNINRNFLFRAKSWVVWGGVGGSFGRIFYWFKIFSSSNGKATSITHISTKCNLVFCPHYENENKGDKVVKTFVMNKSYSGHENIHSVVSCGFPTGYLTIIPPTQMGSESSTQRPWGWEELNLLFCFRKIQLVGQKNQDKTTLASKTQFSRHCFGFHSRCFSLLVGYNI